MEMNQDQLNELEAEVQDALLSGDVVYARELMGRLKQNGVSPEQVGPAAGLYRRLMFARLAQLTEDECLWLFENFILEGLNITDFDLLQALDNRFTIFLETEEQMAFLEKVQKAVEHSQALLGEKSLVIDKKDVPPTVASWLKEYLYTPAQNEYRQSIDELEYVNRGKFAAQLTQEQRNVLLQLLRFYDVLRNSVLQYQRAPVAYVEDYPGVSYDLIQAKPEDFDTPEQAAAAFKLLEKQTAAIVTPPPTAKSGLVKPAINRPALASNTQSVVGPRPNVQGVLSNAPLKKEPAPSAGVTPVAKPAVNMVEPSPRTQQTPQKPSVVVSSAKNSSSVGASTIVSPKSESSKQVLPAKPPVNLPMVEPEELPAVIRAQAKNAPLSKQPASMPKSKSPNLPPTLNMDRIQAEVKRDKNVAGKDIDQRLANLKKRAGNKN